MMQTTRTLSHDPGLSKFCSTTLYDPEKERDDMVNYETSSSILEDISLTKKRWEKVKG